MRSASSYSLIDTSYFVGNLLHEAVFAFTLVGQLDAQFTGKVICFQHFTTTIE